jgi:hypothetical protein
VSFQELEYSGDAEDYLEREMNGFADNVLLEFSRLVAKRLPPAPTVDWRPGCMIPEDFYL